MATFTGNPGNDNLSGTAGADTFRLKAGGDDTASGLAGDDTFYMGAAFTALDTIDGGADTDKVWLSGDYSAGIIFGATTMTNVEVLRLGGAFDQNFATHDATVAAGARLTVNAAPLAAGHNLTFDGSAETDGRFTILASTGGDDLIGGARGDVFRLTKGGVDSAYGGDGNDKFHMGDGFKATDTIDGGLGTDIVTITGLGTDDDLVFSATTMLNVEGLLLGPGNPMRFTTDDATVAAGATLTVNGYAAGNGATGYLFYGGAETDGAFALIGSFFDDALYGGAGADTFNLTLGGGDIAQGNGGDDSFVMGAAFDATDQLDGGNGVDELVLESNYGDPVGVSFAISASMMANFETLTLLGDFDYGLSIDEVAFDILFTVDASGVSAGHSVAFHGEAETDMAFAFIGGAGNNAFFGSNVSGGGGQTFTYSASTNNSGYGGVGSDTFTFVGDDVNVDDIDGGGDGPFGDVIAFDGDYGALALTGGSNVSDIEIVEFTAGHSYTVTITGELNPGSDFTVRGSDLEATDSLNIDVSGATATGIVIDCGDGDDTIDASGSTATVVTGGDGDDTITRGALTINSRNTGGAGYDTLYFSAIVPNVGDGLSMSVNTFTGIDKLTCTADVELEITSSNSNVAAGETLDVDFSAVTTKTVSWNGSAETNGHYDITSGGAGGNLTGGDLSDTFTMNAHTAGYGIQGRGGSDDITCNTGQETLIYTSAAHSSSTYRDVIHGLTFDVDKFDVTRAISTIVFKTGAVNSASFDSNMGSAVNDTIMTNTVLVVTATGGDLIGHVFMIVDGDGTGVYNAGGDFVMDITDCSGTIDTGDFI